MVVKSEKLDIAANKWSTFKWYLKGGKDFERLERVIFLLGKS